MTSRALEEAKKGEDTGSPTRELGSLPDAPAVLTIMEKVDLIAPVLSVSHLILCLILILIYFSLVFS